MRMVNPQPNAWLKGNCMHGCGSKVYWLKGKELLVDARRSISWKKI